MRVNEIFNSIDGEGKRAGELATFIRFCGCNCNCSYCDSKYTWTEQGKEMSVDEIVEYVVDNGYPNITITGGEPLIQENLNELVERLVDCGKFVNIETNGTINPSHVIPIHSTSPNVFVTMDYKSKSSGQQDKMKLENFVDLWNTDVLKFVVANEEEMKDALDFMHKLESYQSGDIEQLPLVYFSPVYGKIEPKQIVEFMQKHNLAKNVRVQLQLHKYFWNPETRGV